MSSSSAALEACSCSLVEFATNAAYSLKFRHESGLKPLATVISHSGAKLNHIILESFPESPQVAALTEAGIQEKKGRSREGFTVSFQKGDPAAWKLAFGRLKHCHFLKMSNVKFYTDEAKEFERRSSKCACSVNSIELKRCFFNDDEAAEIFCSGMCKLAFLTTLKISRRTYESTKVSETLVFGIPPRIRRLIFRFYATSPIEARAVGNHSAMLIALDMQRKYLGDAAFEKLVDGFCAAGATGLRELDLRGNNILHCENLARLIGCVPNLVNLNISDNEFGTDPSAASFCAAFSVCSASLKQLDISCCSLNGPSVVALCRALGRSRALSVFSLSSNAIGAEGAKAIAECLLPEPNALRDLQMRECKLGTEEAKELAKGLRKNRSVLKLDVESNQLNPDGAVAILDSLWEKLTALAISYDGIRDLGAYALSRFIARSGDYAGGVFAAGNSISPAGLRAITLAVAARRVPMEVLDLYDRSNSASGKEAGEAISAGMLRNVKRLDIRGINLGDGGARILAEGIRRRKQGMWMKIEMWLRNCGSFETGVYELRRAEHQLKEEGTPVHISIIDVRL